MKRIIPLLFWTMLLSHACASPGSLVTPTVESVTAMATATLTPTAIQPTPIPPEAPTAVDIAPFLKYIQTPTGIEGFQDFPSVEEIFSKFYPALDEMEKRGLLPKLDPNAPPVGVFLNYTEQGDPLKVNLSCNDGEVPNCIPIAYVKIGDKYVTIMKVKNADGTEGKFAWWNGGLGNKKISRIIDNVLENPTELRIIEIYINPGGPNDHYDSFLRYINDPVFEDAMMKWVSEGSFPDDYKNIIPANSFQ